MKTADLPTALIRGPANPHRLDYDPTQMEELETSIKKNGLINAILVKPVGELYEVIAGERRWRAHVNMNLPTIRCTIRDGNNGDVTQIEQISENFDRADLSPMEESLAIATLAKQFNNDIPSVARAIHRTTNFVSSRLSLLDLQPELKELVHTRRLAMTSALHLARVEDDAHRNHLLTWTINGGASEPVVRAWVTEYELNREANPEAPAALPPEYKPGDIPIVLMHCKICGDAHPYQQLRIARLCAQCDKQIENAPRTQ